MTIVLNGTTGITIPGHGDCSMMPCGKAGMPLLKCWQQFNQSKLNIQKNKLQ
jgi:hypothetical protein